MNPSTDTTSPARRRFTVQYPTFEAGVWAIQKAGDLPSWEEQRRFLEMNLPFNSQETRRRYATSIGNWAFDQRSLDCLALRVWKAYGDDAVLRDVLRERYLQAYPVLGQFVVSGLSTLETGSPVSNDAMTALLKADGVAYLSGSTKRLRATMLALGFFRRGEGKRMVLNTTALPGTAFLVCLHYYFGPERTTISVPSILEHPFWRFLGGCKAEEVRAALQLAAGRDIIAKYASVDRLEQVTTRFSLQEVLSRGIRF